MKNMKIWDSVARPPKEALRPITSGRLAGKSDISPQWRFEIVTRQFGPCGIGWRYEIERLWREEGNCEAVFAFALVNVYVKIDGEWSEAIPGIGGNKLVVQEARGPYNNDEAYKMAVTDALSVAFKSLGVAADVYSGLWDGGKYVESETEEIVEITEDVQGWIDAINQVDCVTDIKQMRDELSKQPQNVQKGCGIAYKERWIWLIRQQKNRSDLHEIVGKALIEERKDVQDYVRPVYKEKAEQVSQ
jgi:hypothetical protein